MSKLKILLVDDETCLLELMTARIQEWGHQMITAISGFEAIDMLKNAKPDVIILDYLMPGMDGIDTLKEIRKIDTKIPVVMFTAHSDVKVIKGVEGLGISAFVPKISIYTNVLETLRTVINMIEKKLDMEKKNKQGV